MVTIFPTGQAPVRSLRSLSRIPSGRARQARIKEKVSTSGIQHPVSGIKYHVSPTSLGSILRHTARIIFHDLISIGNESAI